MAELLVKVGKTAGYEDGDCLCAFNDRRIRFVHAQHICNHEWERFTSDGLRRTGGLAMRWLDRVRQYRFERVNRTQALRVETDSTVSVIRSEVVSFGNQLEDFIKRRVSHPNHDVFGVAGREIWYGGNHAMDINTTNLLWADIQNQSAHDDTEGPCDYCGQDHTLWPLGRLDLRDHLPVRVVNFNDRELAALESENIVTFESGEPIRDPDGSIVQPLFHDGKWQHPRGKWIYQLHDEGEVVVRFNRRNMSTDWSRSVSPHVKRNPALIKDPDVPVGREFKLTHPERAPWLRGSDTVYNVMDHIPRSDPRELWNKRARTTGKRLTS